MAYEGPRNTSKQPAARDVCVWPQIDLASLFGHMQLGHLGPNSFVFLFKLYTLSKNAIDLIF